MAASKPTMNDLAVAIRAHLQRFERDPRINAKNEHGLHPYYIAGAGASGRFVYVSYVNYQGHSHLTRAEATKYLAWLNAGGIGRHFEALREVRDGGK